MADITVQRGTLSFADTIQTATITAGVDYTAPASLTSAFIRITGVFASSNGVDSSFLGAPDHNWFYIGNPSNLLTSIEISRIGDSNACEISWEIIEYTGTSGGANEFIVRGQDSQYWNNNSTFDFSAMTSPTTDADIVCFMTGTSPTTASSRGDISQTLPTLEWVGASDLVRATRDTTRDMQLSVAAVEFTGSNWSVERVEHSYTTDATDETVTIANVGSLSRAFAEVQYRNSAANIGPSVLPEYSFTSTTQITTRVQDNAATGTSVFWVISNSDTGAGAMNVQHVSGVHLDTDTAEFTETITAVSALADASVMGITGNTRSNESDSHRGAFEVRLTAVDTVTLDRSEVAQTDGYYTFSVVEWPSSAVADTTAPILTLPTATPTGVDGVDIGVTSDDTEGQLEGRIYTQGDAPTGTEVHTGTSNETIVASATSITSPVAGVNSFATITGLSPGNYVAKFAQDDTAGNISNAATEAVGANFTIAALVPTITNAGDEVFNIGETITITGTDFEAVQGTGSVVLSPTDDVNDAGAVTQTISTWTGDTSIDVTIVKGSLNFDTNLYLFVTNDSGDTNAAGYVVQIAPVVTIQETFTSLQGVDWASEAGLNVFVWRSVPAAAQDQLLLSQSLDASANSNWGITQGSLNANTPDPVWISVFKADGTAVATSKKITPNYG